MSTAATTAAKDSNFEYVRPGDTVSVSGTPKVIASIAKDTTKAIDEDATLTFTDNTTANSRAVTLVERGRLQPTTQDKPTRYK